MKIVETPPNETERLASLKASGLLDTGPAERFDRLTRLAKHLFDVPVAQLSLVDENRLWLKSCDGLDASQREMPRATSFCTHTLLQEAPLIIRDTHDDTRFQTLPLVVNAPHIRFYVGYPVKLPDGSQAGAFCLMDTEPRDFTNEQLTLLGDFAAIVEDEFALLNTATHDELTGLLNTRGFHALADYALSAHRRRGESMTLGFITLDNYPQITESLGVEEAERALRDLTSVLKGAFRGSDLLARLENNQFAILFADTDEKGAWIAMQYLAELVEQFNSRRQKGWILSVSWGVAQYDEERGSLAQLIAHADKRTYAIKPPKGH